MKTVITTLSAAFFAIATFAGNGNDKGKAYNVNTEKSQVFWTGKKVTGEHTGTLSIKGGQVNVENGIPVSASFDLDFTTIACTDITDEGTNAKFVGHLKSDDFFAAEKFPVGKFEAVSFTPIAGAKDREANYTIKGNLTIKGITNEIEFPAFISTKGDALVANGKATFDRSKFDIRFGSSSFFEGLGDKAIYDDVELTFVLSAKA
jgi:polyisoprenoid-binding protein YceI